MLIIPKKDFPKDLNPIGLKRGDIIEIEVGEASPDFLTLDPSTLKLKLMRDPLEPREPIVKEPKPKKDAASMPLPDLKSLLQAPAPAAKPMLPPAAMPPLK